jgi:hypothetical protein
MTALGALAVAAGLVLVSSPAQAATAQSTTRAARQAYASIYYPTRVRRGGAATYTYKVTGARQLDDETVVLVSYLPHNLGKVRILNRPAHSSCGFNKSKWAVYCVVHLHGQNTFSMRFRLYWSYRYAGWYKVYNYAAPVSLGGGSAWDYVKRVGGTRDLIRKATQTKIV